jgi:hypothetical protein
MRAFIVLAFITGLAMTQTATNYCNAKGTKCASCTAQGTNKSCDSCVGLSLSQAVEGQTNTKQCVESKADNCAQASSTTINKCGACKEGFALKSKSDFTCITTPTQITDCANLEVNDATPPVVTCKGCKQGKVLIDNACTTAITINNCIAASNNSGTQVCSACKEGFALIAKQTTTTTRLLQAPSSDDCKTVVSGDLIGCLRVKADGKTCDNVCNLANNYYQTDINVCTKTAALLSVAFAIAASFFKN